MCNTPATSAGVLAVGPRTARELRDVHSCCMGVVFCTNKRLDTTPVKKFKRYSYVRWSKPFIVLYRAGIGPRTTAENAVIASSVPTVGGVNMGGILQGLLCGSQLFATRGSTATHSAGRVL
jgi:hypothetical protein